MSIPLIATCKKCMALKEKKLLATGELSNDDFHILTCNKGHKIKYFSASPEYPIYFDNGIKAYLENNYFEAFTSIYHSWELFVFTFVKSMLVIDESTTYKEVVDATKHMKKQSTQIEGAFSALYFLTFNEASPTLNNKTKNLRNLVVHGGHNPQKEDIESLAKEIYSFIKKIEIKLLLHDNEISLLRIYSHKRIIFLKEKYLLKDADIKDGTSVLINTGQYTLGKTTRTSTQEETLKEMTFDEILAQVSGVSDVTAKQLAIHRSR